MGFHQGKTPIITGATVVSYKDPACRAGFCVVGAAGMLRQGLLTVLARGNWFSLSKTTQRAVQASRVPTPAPGDVPEGSKADRVVNGLQGNRESLQRLARWEQVGPLGTHGWGGTESQGRGDVQHRSSKRERPNPG